jgi:hypothetical protein
MEAMRVNWTDDRLGERFDHVDKRFDCVETHIRDLRGDMNRGLARADADARDLRTEMNERFDRLDERFDAMQRTLFLAAVGIVAALIGVIATQL